MPQLAEPPLDLQNEYRDPFIRRIKPVDSDVFEAEMHGLNGRLAGLERSVEELRQGQKLLRHQQEKFESKTEERFAEVRQRQESFETKTEERFDKIDAKFDKIDAKFDKIDAKFDILDAKIDAQGKELRQEIKEVRQEIKSTAARQTQVLSAVIAAVGLLIVLARFVDQATVNAILGR